MPVITRLAPSLDRCPDTRHTRDMAKRGQTKPWRMTYTWSNGLKGTTAHHSEDAARFAAEQQERRIGPNGETCTVEVTLRPSKTA